PVPATPTPIPATPTPTPVPTATPAPTCTQTVDNVTIPLRILFMVDHSGSTFGSSGTDADYHYRVGAIQSFLDKYGNKSNFTYSFGYFGADKALLFDFQALKYKQTSANPPIGRYFGTAAELSTPSGSTGALQKYLSISQNLNANTPYQKAFNADKVAVTVDTGNNHATYKYVVIFMSDGQPNPDISDADLTTLIKDTQATATAQGSGLTISSVYFGPANGTTAINKMKLISLQGGGQFVNTNVNSDFTINDVIQVPGCH
ncbi:MAG: VWA domain-containing protein, partial [Bdellovibrionales bacterium]|nr:VWA domain-containing protein [Bdellovibrionales bacterium]